MMNVTLLMTKDVNNTIGTKNGIPWDCTSIYEDFKKILKNKVVIVGSNSRHLFPFLKKLRLKRLIILSHGNTPEYKTISYANDVYKAMSMAKEYETDVYILGGHETMKSFLDEGLINEMVFYVVNTKHDGVTFVNSSTHDYSLISVDKRDDYVISTYRKVPKELQCSQPLKIESIGKTGKSVSNISSNKNNCKSYYDNEDERIKDEIESMIDDLYEDDSEDDDYSMLLSEIDELRHLLSMYAENEEMVVDRLNTLTNVNKELTSMQMINDNKIKGLSDNVQKMRYVINAFGVVILVSLILSIIAIAV